MRHVLWTRKTTLTFCYPKKSRRISNIYAIHLFSCLLYCGRKSNQLGGWQWGWGRKVCPEFGINLCFLSFHSDWMIESIHATELLNNEWKKISERDPFFFFCFYRLICLIAASGNRLLDLSICSCFSGSYQSTGCKKIK